jgi:hypothetical protein
MLKQKKQFSFLFYCFKSVLVDVVPDWNSRLKSRSSAARSRANKQVKKKIQNLKRKEKSFHIIPILKRFGDLLKRRLYLKERYYCEAESVFCTKIIVV